MKKYFLLTLTIAILAFFAAEIAGAAVANPPPGAQKRKIIKSEASYPATPINVINVVEQPPPTVVSKHSTASPSPSPTTVAAPETTEETPKAPKKHAQGVAILLVFLVAAIALGSGGIFIINKMRAAKERDF